MSIHLKVIDLYRKEIQDFGYWSNQEIKILFNQVNDDDFFLLRNLDLTLDTYFNNKQLNLLKKEIELLKNRGKNSKLLEAIEAGIKCALEEGFLKLESIT